MKLDLREIIDVPGGRVPFEQELDTSRLDFSSVAGYSGPIRAAGEIVNTAGVLTAHGGIDAAMVCYCDRCGKTFELKKHIDVDVPIVPEDEGEDAESDAFSLEGDWLDLDDLLETVFILDMDTKFLCRPDCKGLCPKCGRDLNNGPCDCRPETDPRFAVLEQLLDK